MHKARICHIMAVLTLCWAFANFSYAATQQAFRKVSDSVIDAKAIWFQGGTWGNCVNGQSFQQDALTTFKDWQYAIYYDADGRVCLARRRSGTSAWEVLRFSDYRFRGNDTHNVAVLGICPADGTIHIAFDHHGHPLHYRVSKPDLALHPEKHTWEPGLFGNITSELEPGKKLLHVTYPRFIRTPSGRLQFGCRIGGSGNGDKCLADYDPNTKTWKQFGVFVGRSGTYLGKTSRNGYLNGLTYDKHGSLHVTWCWRENGGPLSNHDLLYAWSKDGGLTWLNNSGAEFGKRGQIPITLDSPGLAVVTIPTKRGLMNAMTQALDSRSQVHTVTFHIPDSLPDQTDWAVARKSAHYFHYWRDKEGTWHRNEMNFIGSRPQLWFDTSDNAYLVFAGDQYNSTPGLCIARATRKKEWTDWLIIHREPGPFLSQPQIDRYAAPNLLSVYIQEQPPAPTNGSSPLRVLEFAVPR